MRDCAGERRSGPLRPQWDRSPRLSGVRRGGDHGGVTPGAARNVESFDDPASPFATLAKQLSQVTRLVVWDMRGGGLSDAATQVPPLTERIEDLRTVMNAAGVESATMFGFSEGGATSVLFAATYPQRVRSLVVYGTAARFSQEL